jgi:hypothetical protein
LFWREVWRSFDLFMTLGRNLWGFLKVGQKIVEIQNP